jgi:hypothetical protein
MHASRESWGSELTVHTGLAVDAHEMLRLALARGDHVRADAGTVWITIDGRVEDIVLGAGEVYTAPEDVAVNATGLNAGRLTVLGHRPLRWQQAGATYTAWRSRARRVLARLLDPASPVGSAVRQA